MPCCIHATHPLLIRCFHQVSTYVHLWMSQPLPCESFPSDNILLEFRYALSHVSTRSH